MLEKLYLSFYQIMSCFENNRCLTIDLLFESFLKMTSNQSLKKKEKMSGTKER